ncbi:MAG: hypothetical protein JJ864_07090 [Rhizobiaceae bacterium]|nr:hypothetical protein [Rhizobiaceae bacterium]
MFAYHGPGLRAAGKTDTGRESAVNLTRIEAAPEALEQTLSAGVPYPRAIPYRARLA